ncbi:MAG: hypothetical protein VYA34_06945 [Myxococcota bacterium]|nr:hypothetical protein [Myxococcota bacterium]
MNKTNLLLCFILIGSQGACIKWFPGKVGSGVARLTVRGVAAMSTVVTNDTKCGFDSEEVKSTYVREGEVGGTGKVIWTVSNCSIALPEWVETKTACDGVVTRARGNLVISARRVVEGRLTGNPDKPVVPTGPDTLRIEITDAKFENFEVEDSSSDSKMIMLDGSIKAVAMPRLARNIDGVCAIVTPNARLEDIQYSDALVHVFSGGRDFDVEVQTSNIWAQNGKQGDIENKLGGTITIWDSQRDVPNDGDLLNPDYEGAEFFDSYKCTEEIALPESFACDLEPRIADAASSLTIRTLGNLIKYTNADEACGFASPEVKEQYEKVGTIGYADGTVTWSTQRPCEFNFPEKTEIFEDCSGNKTFFKGAVTLTGKKVVEGILTGDPETPVIPNSHLPAQLSISASFNDFELTVSNSDKSLYYESGSVSGTLTPRMMLDSTTGACSVSTPNAGYSEVKLQNIKGIIDSSGSRFDINIDKANLYAASGEYEPNSNFLDGTVTINRETYLVPQNRDDMILDPDYNVDIFKAGYDCHETAALPENNEECQFENMLAQNASRLVIKTFGLITKTIDNDKECGFGSIDGLIPEGLSRNEQNLYDVQWDISRCVIGGSSEELVATDCHGNEFFLQGTAEVTGSKFVEGEAALVYPPIQPTQREAAMFDFQEIVLNNFSAKEFRKDQEDPEAHLIIHAGKLVGYSHPVTGESASTPDHYFVKIPVSGFSAVRLEDADVTMVSGKKKFRMQINSTQLDAFNGTLGEKHNSLSGEFTLGGSVFSIPVNENQKQLNPNFDQDYFDDSYRCLPDLKEPVPTPATPTDPEATSTTTN